MYTYLEPKWPLFWLEKTSFWTKNKGQMGSWYIVGKGWLEMGFQGVSEKILKDWAFCVWRGEADVTWFQFAHVTPTSRGCFFAYYPFNKGCMKGGMIMISQIYKEFIYPDPGLYLFNSWLSWVVCLVEIFSGAFGIFEDGSQVERSRLQGYQQHVEHVLPQLALELIIEW